MFEGARKQKFKLTFVILGVSVIVLVISFAYGTWARTEREKELVPRLGCREYGESLCASFSGRLVSFRMTLCSLRSAYGSIRHYRILGQASAP